MCRGAISESRPCLAVPRRLVRRGAIAVTFLIGRSRGARCKSPVVGPGAARRVSPGSLLGVTAPSVVTRMYPGSSEQPPPPVCNDVPPRRAQEPRSETFSCPLRRYRRRACHLMSARKRPKLRDGTPSLRLYTAGCKRHAGYVLCAHLWRVSPLEHESFPQDPESGTSTEAAPSTKPLASTPFAGRQRAPFRITRRVSPSRVCRSLTWVSAATFILGLCMQRHYLRSSPPRERGGGAKDGLGPLFTPPQVETPRRAASTGSSAPEDDEVEPTDDSEHWGSGRGASRCARPNGTAWQRVRTSLAT